jgi:pentatricopeptide repeat protein
MNEYRMNTKIVKVGLQVAELTKDPKLAADIICGIGINQSQHDDLFNNDGEVKDTNSIAVHNSFPSIPPSTYLKTINMCIGAGHINSADRILRHCMRNTIPRNTLDNLYLLVLNGYAQYGDLTSTEKMFHEMKENGLVQRYV